MFSFRSRKYREKAAKLAPEAAVAQAASQWILRREQLPEYRFALELMSRQEKETVFWQDWDKLDELAQRDLVKSTFADSWYQLLAGYHNMSYQGKIQILEALGYIRDENVVDFLVNEMKREDEAIRLAAAGALKRQDPVLTIEPMLDALAKPEVFLASRVYDVLKEIGPKLVPVIMHKIMTADEMGQLVMAQLLGAFGDETVLPVLKELAKSDNYDLRKAAVTAIGQIGTEAIVPVLNVLILDANWQIRLLVVEAVKKHRLSDGVDILKRALRTENDPLVRDMMTETIALLEEEQMPTTFLWRRQRKEGTIEDGGEYHAANRRSNRRNTSYSRWESGSTDVTGSAI